MSSEARRTYGMIYIFSNSCSFCFSFAILRLFSSSFMPRLHITGLNLANRVSKQEIAMFVLGDKVQRCLQQQKYLLGMSDLVIPVLQFASLLLNLVQCDSSFLKVLAPSEFWNAIMEIVFFCWPAAHFLQLGGVGLLHVRISISV